jgi:hypothetical protein
LNELYREVKPQGRVSRYFVNRLKEPDMITSKFRIAALAVAVVAMATPALAAKRVPAGYDARAQAIGPVESEGMSAQRADALRECNTQANKLLQKDWGVMQTETLNACLAQHGQQE